MSDSVYSGDFLTLAQAEAIAASMRATIPLPASIQPKGETDQADMGSDVGRYALEDHTHPRQDSAKTAITGSDGRATIMFARTFSAEPNTEANPIGVNDPSFAVIESYIRANGSSGDYTGCVVHAYKMVNPVLASVTVAGVKVAVGDQVLQTFVNATNVKVSVTTTAASAV